MILWSSNIFLEAGDTTGQLGDGAAENLYVIESEECLELSKPKIPSDFISILRDYLKLYM